MSLILDGTTGVPVTTVTGTLPVANGGSGVTTSTGTGAVVLGTSPTLTTPTISTITSAAATALTLQSASTTAVTIDTSQNVGIGTSSPSSYGKLAVSDGTIVFFVNPYSAGSALYSGVATNHAYAFLQNNIERMRIDSSGNLLIGTTTSPAGSKELVLAGDYIEGVVAIGTVTTSNTLSLANGTVQTATLTASTACTFTMPTAVAGKSFMLLLKQAAATGNGTATFTSVKWNGVGTPTITATAGKMDILSFISDGTNWYGSITQGFTP